MKKTTVYAGENRRQEGVSSQVIRPVFDGVLREFEDLKKRSRKPTWHGRTEETIRRRAVANIDACIVQMLDGETLEQLVTMAVSRIIADLDAGLRESMKGLYRTRLDGEVHLRMGPMIIDSCIMKSRISRLRRPMPAWH